MSDLYIRVIPMDPEWQPPVEAAAGAVEYVAGLFAGPGEDVEAVELVFYERITLIDGGQYMEDVFCPRWTRRLGWTGSGTCCARERWTDARRTDHRRPVRDGPVLRYPAHVARAALRGASRLRAVRGERNELDPERLGGSAKRNSRRRVTSWEIQ